MLNEKEKYNFIASKDKKYDDKFYTAVKTTGIFYDTKEESIQNGFRACKICRPNKSLGI